MRVVVCRPGHKNRKPKPETEITETETENTETDLTESYFGCHSSETEINFGIRFLFGLNRINRKSPVFFNKPYP
jgi:hypothetical protein